MDNDLIDEYIRQVIDRFDVYDLVELLGITVESLVDKYQDEIITSPEVQATLGM